MAERQKRNWSNTIDVWTKIISTLAGILIPVAIWLVGEEIKSVERAVTLITHLSSESAVERKLALRVVKQLAAGGQLTPDLAGSLLAVIVDDTDQEVADLALEIAKSNPEFWNSVAEEAIEELAQNAEQSATAQKSLRAVETLQQIQGSTESMAKIGKRLSPRLYIHIASEDQRERLAEIARKLEERHADQGLVVPGIELKAGPKRTALRYFSKAEKEEANRLTESLNELGLPTVSRDASRYVRKKKGRSTIRLRHYELWVGTLGGNSG